MAHHAREVAHTVEILGVIVQGRKRGIVQQCYNTICPLEEMIHYYIATRLENEIDEIASRLQGLDREPKLWEVKDLEQRYSDPHINRSGIQLLRDIHGGRIKTLPRKKAFRKTDPPPQQAHYIDFEGRKVKTFRNGERVKVTSFRKIRDAHMQRLEEAVKAENIDQTGILEAERAINEYLRERDDIVEAGLNGHSDFDDILRSAHVILTAYKQLTKQVETQNKEISKREKEIGFQRKAFRRAVFVLQKGLKRP
ncbi:uncharacterized protein PV09_09379 [Verruconis gallopava]|uniref:Uncharacterized protein n=1 Tax=Verruconis gallopava TaxID=253628 RepID=A0A0D1ZXT3_9PEZI|nr:uncharacterized protein PV09_09379 [Verruconis gallopava]KIV98889.1 hypothetical protein PV09_09379 [Verruconis gallopava]